MMRSTPFPLVSVIVPVRNEEHLIGECLRSLLEQDYPKDQLEIIVVDNNSTDHTASTIRQFPVRYVFEKKRGAAAARNAGAGVARGDFLAFIDSDCVAPPNWVSRLVEAFQENSIDACGGDCMISSRGSFVEDYLGYRGFYSQREFFSPSSPFPPWLMTGNLIIRRTTFERIGGFEEALLRGEDIDFSWRVALAGGRLQHLPPLRVFLRCPPSLIHFYTKNFRDGKAASLLHRRYAFLVSQKKGEGPVSLRPLFALFEKLQSRVRQLFLTEDNLTFPKKGIYFLLICTGHLVFQAGKFVNRIRYDLLKKPLPVPPLLRESDSYPLLLSSFSNGDHVR